MDQSAGEVGGLSAPEDAGGPHEVRAGESIPDGPAAPEEPTAGWTPPTGSFEQTNVWFADPTHRASLRHRVGGAWGPWLSDGVRVWFDPRPIHRPLVPMDLSSLDFITDVFVPEALARDLPVPTSQNLHHLLDDLAVEARLMMPPGATAWAARPAQAQPRPVPATARRSTPVPAGPRDQPRSDELPPAVQHSLTPSVGSLPSDTLHGRRPVPMLRTGPVQEWWGRMRESVCSDLGVHGLAYLGVLLLFIGVFGLVAFAFGDVRPSMRPVAELSAVVVPFLGARLLLGNGAVVVGRALEVVGGLLLPVMLVTSQVDGYPFPPDPSGEALVAGLTVVCLACAVGFALWARRHRDSGVRYAVAPSVWLAAAMATIGVGRALPSGQDVAVPSSHQAAAMAGAFVLSLAVARLRPGARLAEATFAAGVPGLVVIVLLAVLTWAAEGLVVASVAVVGVLLLVALDLLRGRTPDVVADAAGPVWLGAVALALGAVASVGPVAACATVGFVVLLELAGRRRRPAWALGAPAAGLGLSLAVAWPASWWTVGAVGAAGAWATVRRVRPYPDAEGALDVATAGLLAVVAFAVGSVADVWLGVVAGAGVVVLATVAARLPALRRTEADAFWVIWWRWAVAALGVVAVATWAAAPVAGQWATAGVLLALGIVAVVGPTGPTVRPWAVTALAGSAWVLGCSTAGIPVVARGGMLAAAALAMVVAAAHGRVSLGLAGHVTALVALAMAGAGWGPVVVAGLATLGWAITAVRGDRWVCGVAAALEEAAEELRYLPWLLVALGLPATVGSALDVSGALTWSDPLRGVVLAATAVLYATAARSVAAPRPRVVASIAGFLASVAGVVLAFEPWPGVVALAALVLAVAVLPVDLRRTPMRWAAWIAVAPLLGMVARQVWPLFGALPGVTAATITLVAVGGALLVGGNVVCPIRAGEWVEIVRRVGAVELAAALAAAVIAVPMPDAAWLAASIASVAVVVAVQKGAGALAGAALVLAWGAVVALTWDALEERPLVSVAVAAALLLAAEMLHRLVHERGRWTRWDVPVLVAAAPVGLTALSAASDGDAFSLTYALVGGLVVAVGVRLRAFRVLAEVLGWTGTGLILTAAGHVGSGWLALALLALSAAHTGMAVRVAGSARVARQVVGAVAAVAAWSVALGWLALSNQTSVDATATVTGAVLLAAAGATRLTRIDRSWVVVWGTAALVVLAVVALTAVDPVDPGPEPSLCLVAGVASVAVATLVAAAPLDLPGLRDLAAAAVLVAVLLAMRVGGAGDLTAVTALSLVAVLAVAAALALSLRTVAGWTRPVLELGAGAAVVSVCIGLAGLPDASLLVPAVVAAAVEVAAAGVALRSAGVQMSAPVLACIAWLLVAAEPDRTPEWYTIAVGLTLLAVVAVWRRDRRRRLLDTADEVTIAVELAGVAFLAVVSLVEAVTTSPVHATAAIAIGLAIGAWGVVTRVRRRLAAGVVVVLVAVVLLVAVPMVRLLPAWGGAGVWLLLAGVGLVAVLVATMLERGRNAVRSALGRVGELTSEWE